MSNTRTTDRRSADEAFDLRARAEMALSFEAGDPPAYLLRAPLPLFQRRGVRAAAAACLVAAAAVGTVLALRPPELVRASIEHEYYERTLRGNFMQARTLLDHLGLTDEQAVPGNPQLMRPCDIEGHLVYHLTTFFERGGIVTVFAFDQPVQLREASGWWADVYWQVAPSRDGRPLVLVSQQKKALAVALARLDRPT